MTINNSKNSNNRLRNQRISGDFNAEIESGLRRAPIERAKAVREFWQFVSKYFN